MSELFVRRCLDERSAPDLGPVTMPLDDQHVIDLQASACDLAIGHSSLLQFGEVD